MSDTAGREITTSRTARVFKWVVLNALLIAAVYYAAIGYVWAGRIVTAWTVFGFVLAVLATASAEATRRIREAGRSVPSTVNWIIDLGLLFTYVALGWWFIAALDLVTVLLCAAIFEGKDQALDKPAPQTNSADAYRSVYQVDEEGNTEVRLPVMTEEMDPNTSIRI